MSTLATRCPWCETVFRISKEQAAARGGMARCGVCSHSFNALDQLVPARDLENLDVTPTPARPNNAPVPAAARGPAEQEPTAAGGAPHRDLRDLRRPGKMAPLPSVVESVIEPEAAPPEIAYSHAEDESDLAFLVQRRRREPLSRGAQIVFGVLALAALILLAGQATYIWRDEIAARYPSVRPALVQACIALRCKISLPGHIEQITIDSSDLQVIPGGKDLLSFTPLLHNAAEQAQRYPALELTLTDVQDQTLTRRIFQPEEYLPGPLAAHISEGMAPSSELQLRLVIEAPGIKAAQFHTGVFYP